VPYTYSWNVVSGTPFGLTGSSTPTVSATYGGSAGTYDAVLNVTVTDANSNTATATVNAQIVLSL